MVKKIRRMHIPVRELALGERGGVAILMLVAFIVLALPLSIAAVQTAGQLSRSSQVHNEKRAGIASASAGVEEIIHNVVTDANYDAGLTASSPSTVDQVNINGQTTATTATKIFPSDTLRGQGLSISLAVTPDTAIPNFQTTFTYTITLENEGSGAATVQEIRHYLPPYFSYSAASTAGITTLGPTITPSALLAACGGTPDVLAWILSPGVVVDVGETVTLTFDASAPLPPPGIYLSQARVTYVPWWDTFTTVDIYTPYTAGVQSAAANRHCGYHTDVLVTKTVDTPIVELGVETEFTYTITIENTTRPPTDSDLDIQYIEDLLPPTFTYVTGSSSGITTSDPTQVFDPDLQRWRLTWGDAGGESPLITILDGETKTQVLKVKGTLESGGNYLNEVNLGYETLGNLVGANAYADVVLVLDNSASIDEAELVELKNTANAIVDALQLDQTNGRIRIGVNRFRGTNASVVGMTDVDDHLIPDTALHDGINSLVQGGPDLGSGTNIVTGLDGGAAQFTTGLGDRPEIPNLMIFITDGNDTHGNSLTEIANASLASGAEVFAVGVGDVSTETLEAIATDPNGDHLFYTADFTGLLDLVDAIVSASLGSAKQVFDVEGGANGGASVSGGTLYDVESVAADGRVVRSRILHLPDGTIIVKSVQTD